MISYVHGADYVYERLVYFSVTIQKYPRVVEKKNRERYVNKTYVFVCLFVLRLNAPANNFSVMSGRIQRFLGLTSTVGS